MSNPFKPIPVLRSTPSQMQSMTTYSLIQDMIGRALVNVSNNTAESVRLLQFGMC